MVSVQVLASLVVILMVGTACGASSSRSQLIREMLEFQKCGRELTDILKVVCNGRFQSRHGKRSETANLIMPSIDDDQTNDMEWLENALSINGYNQVPASYETRVRRSPDPRLRFMFENDVIAQCCRSQCPMEKMMDYCEKLVEQKN